ncbi:MAG: dTDP-glucose 4,6-dehydratase [Candidatus Marinimicrobia bacterium]|jgi:dTDP-glucose 4,6-dehydratase|nr:dTDP-glucose 4,6-dehydratase [Candidatus Neomarinimicrobiota bacterium]MDP6500791.1 dTDP-glucose 4,6-dehydratase [Candidatus Neomarinimicrobiota bacterium]MDP6725831.1 dTDP-glucose 4,6-dehydratase [Candidatus Neomarinimicrobiota bacterium]|tara:strand:+ start:27121 stop:28185 length:1065 start_codon:yes stop_codon:yes gene_type:complete
MVGKIIIVTGGSGFIGSNFIRFILNEGYAEKIINLDKLTYAGNPKNLSDFQQDERYVFVQGDICNQDLVKELFLIHRPNVVVNFAAESHVDRSIDGPGDFIKTNISGTFTLLQESLRYFQSLENDNQELFRFHHVSTDEVFGSLNDNGFFTEETPYDPSSPYSASKAASDHLVRAWQRTFGLPIIISNCSNNYGPYQFPEKLIPLMILNCLEEKPLPVYGTGENVRDWLYVDDHCEAIHTIIENGKIGETYNVGGNNEIKNIEIVKTICDILDQIKPSENLKSFKELIAFVKDRPGHDFRYAIDSSKLKNELNWQPKETFETGIKQTINWYLENQSWWQDIQNKTYQQERLGVL